MIQRLVLFVICLLTITKGNADVVATIGDTSIIMKSSTSCALKNWKSNPTDACACCITKEKVTTKDSGDEIYRECIKDKSCTLSTISQLAPQTTTTEEIVSTVLWNTLETPIININSNYVDKNGLLRTERVPDFLASLRKELPTLKTPLPLEFSRPKCLEAKQLGAGGVNTTQLFLIKVNMTCLSGSNGPAQWVPKFIIKEPKPEAAEIVRLRQIHQSDLYKLYGLTNTPRSKGKLKLALDFLNIKYKFTKPPFNSSKTHYLTFFPLAPGKSLMNLSKDLAVSIKAGDAAEEHKRSIIFYNSCYAFGKGLGEEHRRFMEKGDDKKKFLRNSYIDGDLHLENGFVMTPQNIEDLDNYIVTIIDPETFALSLKEKRPVGIDLFVLYAFSVSQFKSEYAYPKEISLTKWNNIMLKPFLLGYISNWPAEQRAQLLNELRDVYTNFIAIIKLLPQRSLFINPLSYRAKIKDINRIFDEISKPYKVRKP